MGRFADIVGVLGSTFGIGPSGTRATLDASGLTAPRALALPDAAGTLALRKVLVTTASTALIAPAAVAFNSTFSAVYAAASAPVVFAQGFILDTVASGNPITVYLAGQVVTGLSGLVSGSPIYLSATAGGFTQTPPSGGAVQILGFPLSATSFLFDPQPVGQTALPEDTHYFGAGPYTLVMADALNGIEVENASGVINVVIPKDLFPLGTRIPIRQSGVATLSIQAAAGVTLNAANGTTTKGQFDARVIENPRGSNIWWCW